MSLIQFGARPLSTAQTRFTLWAPQARMVELMRDGAAQTMQRGETGLWTIDADAPAGSAYQYRIDGETLVPDPASRAQQQDVHGPSLVVDLTYAWRHPDWRGRPLSETVIYELHVGAMGGFAGVMAHLPRLAALGVTAIQLMPVADFPGRWNWGYDGVLPYAPDAAYGTPAELQALVDAAHGHGLQVFLDVVYNHFGPDGNYLHGYASDFFRSDRGTPWGDAIDFRRREVRDFFIGNALQWVCDYRFDGLRFDAVHAIADKGFLHELAGAIRSATPGRHVHLILENEENDASLIGGGPKNFDAQWDDDFHHCLHVLLTGEKDAYYEDFQDAARLLARCLAEGFAYQGEPSPHAGGAPRGSDSTSLPTSAFVICLQNHDQVGNRAFGERLRALAHPDALRAAVALLLFTPQIPMLFFGEESGETTPFLFFTDHHDELRQAVTEGRRKEFAKFPAFSDPQVRETIPDPNDPASFEASRPHFPETSWTALYQNCLALRAREIAPGLPGCRSLGAHALGLHAVRASWRMGDGSLLTMAANFGHEAVALQAAPGRQLYGPPVTSSLPACTTCLWRGA
ncbi:malto-oligosyltrehalose trehalohydrolase [Acidocella facilis]|uniref:malto-oligosyltrehalose trehalohydrolase n=1 Tax=Acidocella facilis TaxID=525 RepID=UPI001F3A9E4F|nr:malto-oligosyltrehalose trehalohydrolase [Acidocella facilis]